MIHLTKQKIDAFLDKLKKNGTVRTHRSFGLAPKKEREQGRTSNTKCEICECDFYARPYLKKKGEGRFCSQKCYGEWRSRRDGK